MTTKEFSVREHWLHLAGIASWCVMAYSGWILNRVKQRLRDVFSDAFTSVAVWENTKAGRPHLHLALMANDHEALLRVLCNWHDIWFGILRDLTRKTGVNLFERYVSASNDRSLMSWYPCGDATQADAQIIEQDISRYLSKYISKTARKQSSTAGYHPSRWWSVDNVTRREAKAERCRLSIGGVSIETLRIAYAESIKCIADYADTVYSFDNPIYPKYGGKIAFLHDGEDLAALSYFVRWLDSRGYEYSLKAGE